MYRDEDIARYINSDCKTTCDGVLKSSKNTLELMLTYFSASTAGKTFTPAFCMAWKEFISKPIKNFKLAILNHFVQLHLE